MQHRCTGAMASTRPSWKWPSSREERENHPPGNSVGHDRPRHRFLNPRVLIILALSVSTIGFAAGLIAYKVTNDRRSGTSMPVPVIDLNCSTNTAPTTYIPLFYQTAVYSVFCNADMPVLDIFQITAPSFDACMQSCSSYNSSKVGKASEAPSCEGVTFVPEWLNLTLAREAHFGANCFLKHGPLTVSDLRHGPSPSGHEAIAHSAIILG